MTSLKSAVSAFALAALAVAHGAQPVQAGGSKELRVSSIQAINLDVGVKRAIGYYVANAGNCDLTVLLADVVNDGFEQVPSASRVSVKVHGGTSAQVDTIEGAGMSFTCAAGANDMTVRVFERVALSPVRTPASHR